MKIAYFDCFSGIAGDMALAALLDCGAPLDALKAALRTLPVSGWDITAEPVLRSGIHALNVHITLHGITDEAEFAAAQAHTAPANDPGHTHDHSHAHDHDHSHDHDHTHEHDHIHEHDHDHSPAHHHAHPHFHGRSMAEIRGLIEASGLSERVKRDSLRIFGKIAEAEAYLHHSTTEEIHFHEIGGIDSLVDIVGVAWCLDYLGVEEVYASALPLSSGFVDCAHGRMPVPAPATLEILKGAPWEPTGLRGELVTPTGAGILGALAKGFGTPPAFRAGNTGMGAGKKQFPDRPNLLRVTLGETADNAADGLDWSELVLLETNVDDLNPELWEVVLESLFGAGALDVWLQPIQMKKNRPGQLLGALCAPIHQGTVLAAILRETTTLGVRTSRVRRAALARSIEPVETEFGRVRMKVARWEEMGLRRAIPEYEDVKRLSQALKIPAREVYEAAVRASL